MNQNDTTPKLISLDIDWTQFIPEGRTVESDRGSFTLRDRLNTLRQRKEAFIVHNTGIPLQRVFERMYGKTADYPRAVIAEADAVISDVGTEINLPPFVSENGQVKGKPLQEWQDRLHKICPPEMMGDVRKFIESMPFTTVKHEAFPSPFKVTGVVDDPENHGEIIQQVTTGISEAFGEVMQVTFWSRNGFDITPAPSGKGPALSFLMQHWGIASENVYVAGDSMNDLSMFSENHQFKGIIPGNAMPELVQSLSMINRRNLYLAPKEKSGPHGVLHGLEYFDVIPKSSRDVGYVADVLASNRLSMPSHTPK